MSAVTVIAYWGDTRRYCSIFISISATGAFAGEETKFQLCTTWASCGYITSAGNTVIFSQQGVRYIQWGFGGSDIGGGAYFLQMYAYASATCPTVPGASAYSTSCRDCQPGMYSNASGLTTCSNCSIGSYSNASAASTCSFCPAGQVPGPVYNCLANYVPVDSTCNCLYNSMCACSSGAYPVPSSSRIVPTSVAPSTTMAGGGMSNTWDNLGQNNPGNFPNYPYQASTCASPVFLQYDLGSIKTVSMIVGYPYYGDGRRIWRWPNTGAGGWCICGSKVFLKSSPP